MFYLLVDEENYIESVEDQGEGEACAIHPDYKHRMIPVSPQVAAIVQEVLCSDKRHRYVNGDILEKSISIEEIEEIEMANTKSQMFQIEMLKAEDEILAHFDREASLLQTDEFKLTGEDLNLLIASASIDGDFVQSTDGRLVAARSLLKSYLDINNALRIKKFSYLGSLKGISHSINIERLLQHMRNNTEN